MKMLDVSKVLVCTLCNAVLRTVKGRANTGATHESSTPGEQMRDQEADLRHGQQQNRFQIKAGNLAHDAEP